MRGARPEARGARRGASCARSEAVYCQFLFEFMVRAVKAAVNDSSREERAFAFQLLYLYKYLPI